MDREFERIGVLARDYAQLLDRISAVPSPANSVFRELVGEARVIGSELDGLLHLYIDEGLFEPVAHDQQDDEEEWNDSDFDEMPIQAVEGDRLTVRMQEDFIVVDADLLEAIIASKLTGDPHFSPNDARESKMTMLVDIVGLKEITLYCEHYGLQNGSGSTHVEFQTSE